MRFIDLFAGIGGFHQAMNYFDGELVLAAEIDHYAKETYSKNYGINYDEILNVTEIDENILRKKTDGECGVINPIDILCAGFPCQSFSKAGSQHGFKDETKGTLFFEIERILAIMIEIGRPIKYILLENVANIVTHDNKNTYKRIIEHLCALGYNMNEVPTIISPHQIGIPQLRNRAFFLGVYDETKDKSPINSKPLSIDLSSLKYGRNLTDCKEILIKKKNKDLESLVTDKEMRVLEAWSNFKDNIVSESLGFPIWVDYLNNLPIDYDNYPIWKSNIIIKNRKLYLGNQEFILKWKYNYKVDDFTKTHRKFEWQAGEDVDCLWNGIIQFRPSGVRVKRPTELPALVAMVQIPVIGWLKRRLYKEEIAKLQSFPIADKEIITKNGEVKIIKRFIYNDNYHQSLKQFGNSVNVEVVKFLLDILVK